MRSTTPARVALILIAGLLVASCSDSSTGPSNPQTPDLTALLDEMSLSNMAGVSEAGVPAAGGPVTPSRCTYSATGWFTCPTVTVNGLTFTRTFTLLDAEGHAQSKPDGNTASIETISTVKGTLTLTRPDGPSRSLEVDRREDVTLSGIQTGPRKLTGVATSTTAGTITAASGTLQTRTVSTERTLGLTLPDRRAGNRWPEGTVIIDAETTLTPSGAQSITSTMHAEVTYDGKGSVTITTTTGFGTTTCTFNLANPGPHVCQVTRG